MKALIKRKLRSDYKILYPHRAANILPYKEGVFIKIEFKFFKLFYYFNLENERINLIQHWSDFPSSQTFPKRFFFITGKKTE